jgi:hypothetical protein
MSLALDVHAVEHVLPPKMRALVRPKAAIISTLARIINPYLHTRSVRKAASPGHCHTALMRISSIQMNGDGDGEGGPKILP